MFYTLNMKIYEIIIRLSMMRRFHSFAINVICTVFAIISQFCYYFNCFLDIQLDTLDFRRGY